MLKTLQKKKYWILCLFLVLLTGFITKTFLFQSLSSKVDLVTYPNFYDNPILDDRMRSLMAPHLLPLNHPSKPVLDSLFSKSRVVANEQTLLAAGFVIIADKLNSHVIVAKHPTIPGYVFKLYLDSETKTNLETPHWEWLTRRCVGAMHIREAIKKNNIRHFVVPDKWLYILPSHPDAKEPNREPILVIETEMKLKTDKSTQKAWRTKITREHLDELYAILKTGYGTTGLDRNIPFTKKGRFAFTDTEFPKRDLKLEKVKLYLSEEMQQYWDQLCQKGNYKAPQQI